MIIENKEGLSIPQAAHVLYPYSDQRNQRIEFMVKNSLTLENAQSEEIKNDEAWKVFALSLTED